MGWPGGAAIQNSVGNESSLPLGLLPFEGIYGAKYRITGMLFPNSRGIKAAAQLEESLKLSIKR